MDAGQDTRTAVDATMDRGGADSTTAAGIELGTGAATFRALADEGETLELVFGPQRGWHLDVAVRARSLGADGTTLTYRARTADGTALEMENSTDLSARRVVPDGDGFLRLGDQLRLAIGDPSEVDGMSLTLEAELSRGDESYTDSAVVQVVDLTP